jgi:TPR repeat protein
MSRSWCSDHRRAPCEDPAPGTRWPLAAALAGDRAAQFLLGHIYDEGIGVSSDPALAARWYRAAAIQGHSKAQENLGLLYWDGRGVRRDCGEALRWFDRACGNEDLRFALHLCVRATLVVSLGLAALLQLR